MKKEKLPPPPKSISIKEALKNAGFGKYSRPKKSYEPVKPKSV